MRIVFFGTGGFATYPLVCLSSFYDLRLVVTSIGETESPVGTLSRVRGLPLLSTTNPNEKETVNNIREKSPDIMVVTDYGYILKDELISIPKIASLNLHPSLLPKYRGPAPIQRAIMNGEDETGITTFILSREIDSGNILLSEKIPIGRRETYGELRTRLSRIGGRLLLRSIEILKDGEVGKQQRGDITYAPKIKKAKRIIDWTTTAVNIQNLINGLSPKPGAFTTLRGKRLVLLRAKAKDMPETKPGEIISGQPFYASAGKGVLEILELRPEGKSTMSGLSFKLGYRPRPGEVIGG